MGAYSQHAEYINADATSKRGAQLEATWSAGGPVPRQIVSVEMLPPGLAIVRVIAHFEGAWGSTDRPEIFVVAKDEEGWKIHLHELQTVRP
jgi:hypothetical protein